MNTSLTILCRYLELRPQYLKLLKERDTSDVWRQFAIWMLVDAEHRVIRFTTPGSEQYHAISKVAKLYTEDCKDITTWKTAAEDAYAAFGYAIADFRAVEAAANRADRANRSDSYPVCAAQAAICAAHAAFGCSIAAFADYADYYSAAQAACLSAWAFAAEEAFDAAKDNMKKKLSKLIKAAPLIQTPAIIDSYKNENNG